MRINPEGREGIRINTAIFLIIIAVVTATALMYQWPWWLLAVIDGFLLWRIVFFIRFFRDPQRPLQQQEGVLYAPADGKIVVIEEVEGPECMGGRCLQISIYMTFYNVHVNWCPIGGEVIYKDHFQGHYHLAWHPKSSAENEHTTVGLRTNEGKIIVFRQIAGWIARRIVCYPEVGQRLEQNHKVGCIKFGSRVDVFVPLDSQVLVEIGQKVVGNQTQIVRL